MFFALRDMKRDRLEPDFVRRYRSDQVPSASVRLNIYRVMDEYMEWDRMSSARYRSERILDAAAEEARIKDEKRRGAGGGGWGRRPGPIPRPRAGGRGWRKRRRSWKRASGRRIGYIPSYRGSGTRTTMTTTITRSSGTTMT